MGIRKFLMTGVAALAFTGIALAQESKTADNEALRHLRAVAEPQLSPAGDRVLVTITENTADGAASHLWLIDIAANHFRQITFSPAADKRGETMGRWTEDGAEILFLAKRDDHTQLFHLPMTGGEAQPFDLKVLPAADLSLAADALPPRSADAPPAKIEPLPIDVTSFAPAPAGSTIALLARDPETPGEKKQQEEKADAVLLDHDPHGVRLYLLDPATAALRVASVPANVEEIIWNKAGDQLIAIAEAGNGQADLAPARSAWIVPLKDPEHPTRLSAAPATIANGGWSADGKVLFLLAQAEQDAPPGYHDLFALTLADGSLRNLSAGLAVTPSLTPPIAVKGGVLQLVENGTRQEPQIFSDGKHNSVTSEVPVVRSIATNAKQTGFVLLGSGPTEYRQLLFTPSLGQKPRALKLPLLGTENWPKAPTQLVRWSNEGQMIDGLLSLPPQAKQGKVPLILMVHGGPTGAWQDGFDPLVAHFLAQGWAVLRPNPRGSTGYGAAFAAANKNDLGGADFRDLMAGIDKVIADFPVDAQRLAFYGYSYGGEMAGFAEGKTDRFKAIVGGAPVIDQFSEYGTEDGSYYDRWFYGYPWVNDKDAWRQSPLAYVGQAKTPFLLLQGEADSVDPLGQSLEYYRALRQRGVEVAMVRYPRDNHGPLAQAIDGVPLAEKWHGFDARQRIVSFIQSAFAKVQ